MLIAASFIALGLALLKAAGLVLGGIAGIALILSYLTGLNVGGLYFALNAPFYLLAQRALGWRFTLKTFVTNVVLFGLSVMAPRLLPLGPVNPACAAILGGTLIGMGLLALARHKSSIGGIGVLMTYLYKRHGVSLARTQVVTDVVIICAGLFAIDVQHLLLSLLSAAALSLVLFVNHKPGRYVAE